MWQRSQRSICDCSRRRRAPRPFAVKRSPRLAGTVESKNKRLLSGSGVMGSGLVVNRPREAESLGVGPDRDVDPLVALGAEESESHGGPDQIGEPARRGEVL